MSGVVDVLFYTWCGGCPVWWMSGVVHTMRKMGHPPQSVEYVCWQWIYHANNWRMNVSWRISVCLSGTGLGNVHFWKMYVCIGYMLPTIWGVWVSWICMLVLDISCQQLGAGVSIISKNWVFDKGWYLRLEFFIRRVNLVFYKKGVVFYKKLSFLIKIADFVNISIWEGKKEWFQQMWLTLCLCLCLLQ